MTADVRGDEEEVEESAPFINVTSLSYAFPDGSTGLHDISFTLPPSSRTLLVGGKAPHLSLTLPHPNGSHKMT